MYRCLFDRQSDAEDGNNFPDGWTRKSGFGDSGFDKGIAYPYHLTLTITENPNPFGNYVLRFAMDGGGAAVFSPKIAVKAGLSYTVSVYVQTQNLTFDEASLQLDFYGKERSPVQTVRSKGIRRSNGWQQIVVGPVIAEGETLTACLSVVPNSPTGRQDYKAYADFADFEIRENSTVSLTTVSLSAAGSPHFFFSTRDISVKCNIQGFDPEQTSVTFTLEDPFGKVIAQRNSELMVGNYAASKFVKNGQLETGLMTGTAAWSNLPIRSPGFYCVRIKTPEQYIRQLKLPPGTFFEDPLADSPPLTFAVMKRNGVLPGGEFGWNLDGWDTKKILDYLPVLHQSGISQLKLDFPPAKTDTDILASLTGFQCIGIVRGLTQQNELAQIEAGDWAAGIQPLLQKMSLTIRDWQWSPDDNSNVADLFFNADGNVTADGFLRFQVLQQLFDPSGFALGIGIVWNNNYELPNIRAAASSGNRNISPLFQNVFFIFPADNTITPDDAFEYFHSIHSADTQGHLPLAFRRFASVRPLPADDYALETRITDFVQRLVLLKVAGLEAVFLESPADNSAGVLRQHGQHNGQHNASPGVMYLPWRTTATLLSGTVPMGSIKLPNRSRNYCFEQSDGKCLMVVWNNQTSVEKPVIEKLYLGEDALITDVWGKTVLPETDNFVQEISVTPVPVFVSGLDAAAVRYRLGLETDVKSIPAVPNQKHRITYKLTNPLLQAVSVQIIPQPPREGDWTIEPPSQTLLLEPKAGGEGIFDLTLMPKANTGLQLFRYGITFNDKTAGASSFSVFDQMQVGNPDVFMEFVSRLNSKDEIEVIQTFNNNTETVLTYDCRLSVPGRPALKSRIMRQGFGRAEHIYNVKRGGKLVQEGVKEMTLRAVPLNSGSGTVGEPLNYSIPLLTDETP